MTRIARSVPFPGSPEVIPTLGMLHVMPTAAQVV
jgi:hypothetical protein